MMMFPMRIVFEMKAEGFKVGGRQKRYKGKVNTI
jgi:hypothetical protein